MARLSSICRLDGILQDVTVTNQEPNVIPGQVDSLHHVEPSQAELVQQQQQLQPITMAYRPTTSKQKSPNKTRTR